MDPHDVARRGLPVEPGVRVDQARGRPDLDIGRGTGATAVGRRAQPPGRLDRRVRQDVARIGQVQRVVEIERPGADGSGHRDHRRTERIGERHEQLDAVERPGDRHGLAELDVLAERAGRARGPERPRRPRPPPGPRRPRPAGHRREDRDDRSGASVGPRETRHADDAETVLAGAQEAVRDSAQPVP